MKEYVYGTQHFNYSISFLLLALISVIVYKLLRKRFPYKVNCWFCNENTKVHYNEITGFICPSCRQYNGFNSDGGYNKCIPEQHNDVLNSQTTSKIHDSSSPSNGLCRICNNNQQLKVYQLAHFVPMNEDNYDIEIEHFQKQLDKAYKLCLKCDKFLKKTISKQNNWMLGLKVSYLRKNSLGLNLNNANDSSTCQNKSYFKTMLCVIASGTVAGFLFYMGIYTFNITYILPSIKMSHKTGIKYILNIYNHRNTVKLIDGLKDIFSLLTYQNFDLLLSTPVLTTSIAVLISLVYYQSYLLYKKDLWIQDSLNMSKESQNKSYISSYKSFEKNEKSFLKSPMNSTDISTDTIESDYESFNKTINKRKNRSRRNGNTTLDNGGTPIFGERALFENSLSNFKSPVSFTELNTYPAPTSVQTDKLTVFQSKCDLNVNLQNLNLSSNMLKPKCILSPPKFRNPWTGRYWDNSKIDMFSRSSSQSSGFFSSIPEINSLPNSRTNSICGELECSSMLSEPIFHIKSNHCSFIPVSPQLFYNNCSENGGNSFQHVKPTNLRMKPKSLNNFNLTTSVCSDYSSLKSSNKNYDVSNLFSTKIDRV